MTFKDTCAPGAHTVTLDGLTIAFDAKSTIANPTPEQVAALTASPARKRRFTSDKPIDKPVAKAPKLADGPGTVKNDPPRTMDGTQQREPTKQGA